MEMDEKKLLLALCGVSALSTVLNIYFRIPIIAAVFGFITVLYGGGYFIFDRLEILLDHLRIADQDRGAR